MRKHLAVFLILIVPWLGAAPVQAQTTESAIESTNNETIVIAQAPKADAKEEALAKPADDKVEGDGKTTLKDVAEDTTDVVKAVADYRDAKSDSSDKTQIRLLLMAMLAAIFKLMLSGIKMTSPFWKGRKGKTVLKLCTLGLGVAVFLTSALAAGEGWWDAFILGLSGPIAVAGHEYTKLIPALFKKKDADAGDEEDSG